MTNPQSLNKYQYAYNNPLRYIDPNGHEADDLLEQDPQEGPQQKPAPTPAPRPYGLQPVDPQRTREMLEGRENQYRCEQGDRSGTDRMVPPVQIPSLIPSPQPPGGVGAITPPSPRLGKSRNNANRKEARDNEQEREPKKTGKPRSKKERKKDRTPDGAAEQEMSIMKQQQNITNQGGYRIRINKSRQNRINETKKIKKSTDVEP